MNKKYLTKLILTLLLAFSFIANSYSQDDYDSWTSKNYSTGETPGCFSFKPKYNFNIDNFLRVTVGGNTDVVVKLVNLASYDCIRYVYIRGGESFEIKNIPEGFYFVKIAYGTDWKFTSALGTCFGKFTRNNDYIKGEDMMDFSLVKTPYGYDVPFYELRLDVFTTNKSNSFESEQISEEEFMK